MSVEWINHKGKRIIYINYQGLSKQEMLDLITEATRMIVDSGLNNVLSLTDMRGCYVDKQFLDQAKKQSLISIPHTEKAAILGVAGIKKVLLKALNSFSSKPRMPFDSIDAAKDWLVESHNS